MTMRRIPAVVAALLLAGTGASAQSVLERSPNLHGVWTAERGTGVFVLGHRFVFLDGGNELLNFPTLTLAAGLPWGLTLGLDYTSNSEIVPDRLGGNETQYWLKRAAPLGATTVAGVAAYNTAARSVDGAVSARHRLGPFSLLGELRAASSQFGSGDAGVGGALGATLAITPYLAVTADIGRLLQPDTFPAVWSAGIALAIPGSPHTLSIHAANAGAVTLQGAARERVILSDHGRYGFVFTAPLGTLSQWARIVRPAAPRPAPDEGAAATVEIRMVAFAPGTVRIRAGEAVEWINHDPIEHTATADDESWGSAMLAEGERFVHRFDRPGRYPYFCLPHPQMTGVVIVEPAEEG